jgi:hypothetical protein
MSLSHRCRAVVCALPLALLLGCGDEPSPESALPDQVAELGAAAAKPPEAVRDACRLITKAEVDAILHASVTPRPKSNPGWSSCDYEAPGGGGFSLKVVWSGGEEELKVTKSAMQIAPTMLRENGMEPASMLALRPVSGLGEEAYFNPIAGSYVRQGDVLLEFDLRLMLFQAPTQEAAIEQWRALAGKALDRL